jgi:myosin-crossreactive antigen
MNNAEIQFDRNQIKAYVVGGGIAALASAAYLIRDGGLLGENIRIFEGTICYADCVYDGYAVLG